MMFALKPLRNHSSTGSPSAGHRSSGPSSVTATAALSAKASLVGGLRSGSRTARVRPSSCTSSTPSASSLLRKLWVDAGLTAATAWSRPTVAVPPPLSSSHTASWRSCSFSVAACIPVAADSRSRPARDASVPLIAGRPAREKGVAAGRRAAAGTEAGTGDVGVRRIGHDPRGGGAGAEVEKNILKRRNRAAGPGPAKEIIISETVILS